MSRIPDRPQNWQLPDAARSQPLDRFLREQLSGLSWNQVRKLISTGKLSINGIVVMIPTTLVCANDTVALNPARPLSRSMEPRKCPLVYIDSQIVVVEKPAGISTVPFDPMERDTLLHRVRASVVCDRRDSAPAIHVVHRIDKETSGLVVFARTHMALKLLKQLFRVHAIDRHYWALVQGRLTDRTIRSRLVADRGDGRRGSTKRPQLGRDAITHVRVLENFQSASLIECRLETGRTHQIRIHLSEAGHPLLGEKVYAVATWDAASIAVPRMMLHARTLGFQHPFSGEMQQWVSEPPDDMAGVLKALRAKPNF